MGSFAKMRSVLTAVVVALLIVAAVSGECIACGIGLAASLQAGGCCERAGQCKAPPHKNSPRCVKEQSAEFVVVDQLGQVPPVLPPADFCTGSSTESGQNAVILVAFRADYSPPELPILHSALLL
jgi:hypothetical protein